ncbi:hypothetical protein [Luteimonas aquatica]|uniref:hypothetical protein n=1 Tax=Luteimonas aquatica TaxID=450364 RepID=UPI001F5682B0|nr:hypothetical protein [Luteimonas aquatica]
MRLTRRLLPVLLLCCAAPATAQQRIEQQMTPEQFKAAGLDKLSADELVRLNAWLNRTLDAETGKAAAQAKKRVEDENRGFFNFGSSEPIVSRLVGEFRGFARGRQYALENGQVWRQTDEATLAGVRLNQATATINPSMVGNAWYLRVEGYNTRAKVERLK